MILKFSGVTATKYAALVDFVESPDNCQEGKRYFPGGSSTGSCKIVHVQEAKTDSTKGKIEITPKMHLTLMIVEGLSEGLNDSVTPISRKFLLRVLDILDRFPADDVNS